MASYSFKYVPAYMKAVIQLDPLELAILGLDFLALQEFRETASHNCCRILCISHYPKLHNHGTADAGKVL
jgi:hypothetical protein